MKKGRVNEMSATTYINLMSGADVFAIARQIIKQCWDGHAIAKRVGGRDDLTQEVTMILVAVQSGNIVFDPDRKSKRSKKLYVGKQDFAREMGCGDHLASAYSFSTSILGEDDPDIDMVAEIVYKTLSMGKEKKELDRVCLGKTSELTGGVVSFEGFVMGTIRRRSLGAWMIESPRPAREEQVAADVRIAVDLNSDPGQNVTGENQQDGDECRQDDDEDALSVWAADEFLRAPDPDLSYEEDTETRMTHAQRILQCKSVDLASLLGCTPRTIQNMRSDAKPPGAD